ncbi:MAG: acriflavin resistance protein, partial [Paracoccaceae bacterium]|nr:acriflavin resistance protein [Paracoccaceae bacterium]
MPPSPPRRRAPWRLPVEWLGIVPFVAFAALFLILPTMKIVVGAFQTADGSFTLQNLMDLNTDSIRSAYWTSIKLSLITALLGCAVGFAMAAAVVFGGLPKRIRGPLLTFSGVASNFAGVPLAFAFIATLGPAGLVTLWLRSEFGINLRA